MLTFRIVVSQRTVGIFGVCEKRHYLIKKTSLVPLDGELVYIDKNLWAEFQRYAGGWGAGESFHS